MREAEKIIIQPQAGKQMAFASSKADITFYGGAAGAGKTIALLIEGLRHIDNGLMRTSIFRRTFPQIDNAGGLWDEAKRMYEGLAKPIESKVEMLFKSGMRIKFSHMQREKDKMNYNGAQIGLICFDELQDFSETQFRFMLSRNRSASGVKPYMRCTCNPLANSWIKKYIDWYLLPEGVPDETRSGKIRWFVVVGDDLVWGKSKIELIRQLGKDTEPLSFTFISAKVYDNPALLKTNPRYLANLKALIPVERKRLLEGNWNIVIQKGDWFNRDWVEVVDYVPIADFKVWYWDRAASERSSKNPDPDATVGIKMCYFEGVYYIIDMQRFFKSPFGVKSAIINVCERDSTTTCVLEQDPGQAGKVEAQFLASDIIHTVHGCSVRLEKPTTEKLTRFKSFSSAAHAGLVKIVQGEWNDYFFQELESLGTENQNHDDVVDGTSGAFNFLKKRRAETPFLVSA